MKSECSWSGVFPAATTQFDAALDLDLAATRRVQAALIRDGVHGLVLMGTVGEGNSLSAEEKRKVLEAAVEASEGKVPVIAGVSELTTAAAVSFARDAERIGASGLMVLPAMVYVPTPTELEHHFRAVAGASALPIMLYNNPPSYRVNIDLATLERLASVAQHRRAEGIGTRFAPLHRYHQCLRRALCPVRGTRRCGLRGSRARRPGLGLGSHECLSGGVARALRGRRRAAICRERARSTAGSCRSCTSIRIPIWCRRSSSPSRSWAAAASACGRRVCRSRASAAPR